MGEDVGFGAGAGHVGFDGGGAEKLDGNFDQFAGLDFNHVPGSVLRWVDIVDDDLNILITLDVLAAGSLDHLVDLFSVVRGGLDDGLNHGESRGDTSLEVLTTQHDTSSLSKEDHGLSKSQRNITSTSLGVELSELERLRSAANDVRAPAQVALLHGARNSGSEDRLGVLSDILVDVEVLHSIELTVHSLVPLLIVAERSSSAVLVGINSDVRVEVHDQSLHIASLLGSETDVISVGIVTCAKEALEVGNTIGVVSRKDHDVHLFQN